MSLKGFIVPLAIVSIFTLTACDSSQGPASLTASNQPLTQVSPTPSPSPSPPETPAPLAPTGLRFERNSSTSAKFSWNAVTGADSYILRIGSTDYPVTGTETTLTVPSSQFSARVLAVKGAKLSEESLEFPVLFDVKMRACNSDFIQAGWQSAVETDARVFYRRTPTSSITSCFAPLNQTSFFFGDIGQCSDQRLPASMGGFFTSGQAVDVTIASTDRNGYQGIARTTVTLPSTGCVCAETSSGSCGSCALGFDLDAGVSVSTGGDLSIATTTDGSGGIASASLAAVGGAKVLASTYMCEVDQADDSGLSPAVPIFTGGPNAFARTSLMAERTTTLVVKSRSGKLYKLGVKTMAPIGVRWPDNAIIAAGLTFDFIQALPDGSFDQ